MTRILTTLTALALLIGMINLPSFAVADHCEKETEITAFAALSTDQGLRAAPEEHEGECPTQHHSCIQLVTILHKNLVAQLGWPEFDQLQNENSLRFQKAPVLEGPFQPPRA